MTAAGDQPHPRCTGDRDLFQVAADGVDVLFVDIPELVAELRLRNDPGEGEYDGEGTRMLPRASRSIVCLVFGGGLRLGRMIKKQRSLSLPLRASSRLLPYRPIR